MRTAVLLLVTAISIVGVFSLSPIPQDLGYHNFSDKRGLFNIPNFGDVASNLFFILFGVTGMLCVYGDKKELFSMRSERLLWKIFFIGAIWVGFGSGYYHLEPNNQTLVWDRLPMTVAFMSFFSLVIMERIDEKLGIALLPILLTIGVGSVFYWNYTESQGQGDLRLYALVQFLPMLLLPLIFWLYPGRYSGLKFLGYVIVWYALAKVFEHFDVAIFDLTGNTVSGHTIKHIAASISIYMMLKYIQNRKIINQIYL